MNITEYKLTITYDESNIIKELIYRGNENIIITQLTKILSKNYSEGNIENYHKDSIRFPRNILEKFMEMINE